jgi:hypothetical protein
MKTFCGRVLGVNHQSVINWANAEYAALPAASPPVASPEKLELDEMFTFVGSKSPTYVVTIVEGETRCVVAWAVCEARTRS